MADKFQILYNEESSLKHELNNQEHNLEEARDRLGSRKQQHESCTKQWNAAQEKLRDRREAAQRWRERLLLLIKVVDDG